MKICFKKENEALIDRTELNALYTLCLGQLEEQLNLADDMVADIRRGVYDNCIEQKKDVVMTALNSINSMMDLIVIKSKGFGRISKDYPMLSLKVRNIKNKFVKIFNNLESIAA